MAGSTEDTSRHRQRDNSPPMEKRSRSPSHTHTRHKRQWHDDEGDDRRSSRRSTRDTQDSLSPSRRRQRRERSDDSSEGPSTRRSKQSPSRDRHRHRHRHHHRHHTHRSRSHSPNRNPSHSPPPAPRPRRPLPTQEATYTNDPSAPPTPLDPPAEKQKPNYNTTGLLAAESNKITLPSATGPAHSIILKYHEPPEARKPPASQPWTCFVFKGAAREPLATIPLAERSCWLLGREGGVADILTEHPSCSKQHAVLQFRHVGGRVRLYVIDLESGNGTWVNGGRVEGARYVECLSGDVVRFGESEREYVLLLPEG